VRKEQAILEERIMNKFVSKQISVGWKVHTPNLLKEILNNPGTGILTQPISIFGKLLAEVGERAAEINDPRLNALMIRLTIYSASDPNSPDYDAALCKKAIEAARENK
jgi:hypothetical protein